MLDKTIQDAIAAGRQERAARPERERKARVETALEFVRNELPKIIREREAAGWRSVGLKSYFDKLGLWWGWDSLEDRKPTRGDWMDAALRKIRRLGLKYEVDITHRHNQFTSQDYTEWDVIVRWD